MVRDIRWAVGSIAAGFVLVGVLLAVTLGLVTHGPSPPPNSDLVAIPTSELIPGMACNGALLEAELITHPDWGVAVRGSDNLAQLVFWPRGYVGRARTNEVEVLNPAGEVVARTGEWISAGGGQSTIDGLSGFIMCPDGPTVIQAGAP